MVLTLWSYNYYFDFTKAYVVSSHIFCYLNFHKTFYMLKNYDNLINDFSTVVSDTRKLLILTFLCIYLHFLCIWFQFKNFKPELKNLINKFKLLLYLEFFSDKGLCYIILTLDNWWKFLASDGTDLKSVH